MSEVSAQITKKSVDISLVGIGLMLIIVSGYSIWSTPYLLKTSFLPSGKILQCIGACKYKSPDDYFWLDATTDLAVVDKSMVFTPNNSTATILLSSGSKLTLYPNSLVKITTSKKGSTIDIIEGKINFDKLLSPSVTEKITIKGKELEVAPVNEESPTMTEISAEPELLEVKTPEVLFYRNAAAIAELLIQNGKGPFKIYLDGQQATSLVTTSQSEFSYKIHSPGVYNLKIEDSTGSFVTKLLNVVDLSIPEIKAPLNGDFVYLKTFKPSGDFDPNETEFKLSKDNNEVFLGKIQNLPKDLKVGAYELKARRFKLSQVGEWSRPISFTLVDSKRPFIETKNHSIFFDQATLRWKRRLPVLHLLTIKNENTLEEVKFNLVDEQFEFSPRESGQYVWSLRPILETNAEEKIDVGQFSVIMTSHLLQSPQDKEHFISSSLEEEVTLSWASFPSEDVSVSLEIRDQKNKKVYDVTMKDSLTLELNTLQNYRWKLVLKTDSGTASTPTYSFVIDAPPTSAPIKAEDIIFKDSD
jgi:hypothetical protein